MFSQTKTFKRPDGTEIQITVKINFKDYIKTMYSKNTDVVEVDEILWKRADKQIWERLHSPIITDAGIIPTYQEIYETKLGLLN